MAYSVYRKGYRGSAVRFATNQSISLLQSVVTDQAGLLLNGYWDASSEGKRPRSGDDHSLPTRAEIKNEWGNSCTFP
jgi:hypothetical protein